MGAKPEESTPVKAKTAGKPDVPVKSEPSEPKIDAAPISDNPATYFNQAQDALHANYRPFARENSEREVATTVNSTPLAKLIDLPPEATPLSVLAGPDPRVPTFR